MLCLLLLVSPDAAAPFLTTALDKVFVSKARICGLNLTTFGREAAGVQLHTAEAAVVKRETPSDQVYGFFQVRMITIRV